jgi:hypothetical protein
MTKEVTVCVLGYGDYPHLMTRCLSSILAFCPRERIEIFVGLNNPSPMLDGVVAEQLAAGNVDRVFRSELNRNKCPAMREMFAEALTPYVWWFDDDSHIKEPSAYYRWMDAAYGLSPMVGAWGHVFYIGGSDYLKNQTRNAPWYRGLPFEENWWFPTGGCWMARTDVVHGLGWPHVGLIKRQDDVLFGEALRQNGFKIQDIGPSGVLISDHDRRGVE